MHIEKLGGRLQCDQAPKQKSHLPASDQLQEAFKAISIGCTQIDEHASRLSIGLRRRPRCITAVALTWWCPLYLAGEIVYLRQKQAGRQLTAQGSAFNGKSDSYFLMTPDFSPFFMFKVEHTYPPTPRRRSMRRFLADPS